MPTFNQIFERRCRQTVIRSSKTPALERCPQKKGVCAKIVIRTPKKPNSALRKVAALKLFSTSRRVFAYIPGETHTLKQYSIVLMRGGRVKDLPGMKYHLIRGKFDLLGLKNRKTSRSKYGMMKSVFRNRLRKF